MSRLTVHHVIVHVQDHESWIGHNATQLARVEGAEMLRGHEMNGIIQAIKDLRIHERIEILHRRRPA